MVILGLDSSAVAASCAVSVDGKIVSEMFLNNGFTHSVTLMGLVDSALKGANKTLDDVDLCAVSVGPGSFTGIRIGIATVKGLCFGRKINVVPVSTLTGIAYPMRSSGKIAVAVMDARCSQVYTSSFDCRTGFDPVSTDEPLTLAELKERLDRINGEKVLIGDGANISYEFLKDDRTISICPEPVKYQHASSLCLYAEEHSTETVSADDLVPVYLRLSQAERELKKKQNKGDKEK